MISNTQFVVMLAQNETDREQLANLLKVTRTLYSFDSASALLNEACACGVNVLIVTKDGYKKFSDNHEKIAAEFPAQYAHFIERTQNSNYKGRLQSRYRFAYWAYAVCFAVLFRR